MLREKKKSEWLNDWSSNQLQINLIIDNSLIIAALLSMLQSEAGAGTGGGREGMKIKQEWKREGANLTDGGAKTETASSSCWDWWWKYGVIQMDRVCRMNALPCVGGKKKNSLNHLRESKNLCLPPALAVCLIDTSRWKIVIGTETLVSSTGLWGDW